MNFERKEIIKYRKKPVIIEAFRWTGDIEQTENPLWIKDAIQKNNVWITNERTRFCQMHITTLEGEMVAELGDYIIRGIKGELYPCKPDIFEQTYEKVDE